jgi:hypothetical protein
MHEIPIQAVKGTGILGKPFLDAVVAILAIITHLIDITAAGGVGLGSN